ncbi:2OG-Fe(II) oxygenase [Citrobacter meridianamericanus]|uniref:2OG-Fe(II) oxygenase n=1 Tax=Citrobacter meridianamericanus TaxID=2894201 RepID=UPI00351D50CA
MSQSTLISNLIEKGWFYQENFFTNEVVDKLVKECNSRSFFKAGIGKCRSIDENIRSDEISWLTDNEYSDSVIKYISFIKELSNVFNRELFLGLNDYEAHFATYPVGAFYKPHFDNFRGKNNRVITVIIYLNQEWTDSDGGEICLYGDNKKILLNPTGGSILCFISSDILHEVLPTNKERMSLTCWLLNNKNII